MTQWRLSRLHTALLIGFGMALCLGLWLAQFGETVASGARLCLSCIGLYG